METLEVLKEIILDNQNQDLFVGSKREIQFFSIKGKASIFIGVRRCGKSTLLHQKIEKLKEEGKKEQILYVNFFDDRLLDVRAGNLNLILEAYYSLYPQNKEEKKYIFLDELQECLNWEAFIDRVLRTENTEVYISGSSAKLLSNEIATQMRGRSLSYELFPFSFKEYLDYFQQDYDTLTSSVRHQLQFYYNQYFENGAFPEVADLDRTLRVKIHQEYFKTIVYRDVIERFDSNHPKATMQLAHRLLASVSSLYSINRMTEYLKSLGYKVSKDFVSECITWFEDAYLLYSVKKYDLSESKQNVNPKKIYCVDHALVNSICAMKTENRGYLLENIVFMHIRRFVENVFYYRTKKGHEVDFYYRADDGRQVLTQVSWDMSDEKTAKREIRALEQAMEELKQKEATIVTASSSELITSGDKTIRLVPVWKYLLEG